MRFIAGHKASSVMPPQMQPAIALNYDSTFRPRWVTPLGTASIVFGSLSVLAGVARLHDVWHDVFDPTLHWTYPPPAWVGLSYVAAVTASVLAAALFIAAAVRSMITPSVAIRCHISSAECMLAAIVATAILRNLQFWRNPDSSLSNLIIEALFECAILGFYPVFVLLFVGRKIHAGRSGPIAV